MPVPLRYTLAHGPAIAALGRVAMSRMWGKSSVPRDANEPRPPRLSLPSPWIEARLRPRSREIVRRYIRHVGGDPGWYPNRVPPHFFSEWTFALAERTLEGSGYPLARGMNAGCRIESRAPLPADEPLHVRARIESIDDDGRRAVVVQKVITGTSSVPDAIVAEMRVFFPLRSSSLSDAGRLSAKKLRSRPMVPSDAHEIAFARIDDDAGLDFAKLTGDFNPIHWVRAYARAAGFPSVILHGFSTFARAIEALNRSRFAGDPSRLTLIDARFGRPLALPAQVGVYVTNDGSVWVGDAPGGGAYLEGRFETEARS